MGGACKVGVACKEAETCLKMLPLVWGVGFNHCGRSLVEFDVPQLVSLEFAAGSGRG